MEAFQKQEAGKAWESALSSRQRLFDDTRAPDRLLQGRFLHMQEEQPHRRPEQRGQNVDVEESADPVGKRRLAPTPANQDTSRGPRSRAGLSPSWVSGATGQMMEVAVRPMKTGARALPGRPTLPPSASAKIIVTSRKVPSVSPTNSRPQEMEPPNFLWIRKLSGYCPGCPPRQDRRR